MKRRKIALLITLLIIWLFSPSVLADGTDEPPGTGLPPGTEERLLEAEAVAKYTPSLYFDKSGNRVDDLTQSYYGASYKLKCVLSFWNVGALGWSKDHKYADAEMKLVLSPDNGAFATQEDKMVKEANAPWEDMHFDDYKNDPAWVASRKNLEAEIEAIKEIELPIIEEPLEILYFTGGAWGQFKKPDTFELVGKIEQLGDTSHIIKFVKEYDYTEFAGKYGIEGGTFSEFKITSKQPFIEWEGYFEGGFTVKEQVLGSISIGDMSGDVEIRQPGEDYWDLANLGVVGFKSNGGTIRTGPESYVVISFSDMNTMILGPDSEVMFIKSDPVQSNLRLVYGTIMGNIKKMIKDGTMEITMNQAVAGIKGTVFVCEENGENSTLKVLEGTVEFTDKNGQIAMLKAGDQIASDIHGLMPIVKFNVQEEQNKWDRLHNSQNKRFGLVTIIVIVAVFVLFTGFVLLLIRKRRTAKGRA